MGGVRLSDVLICREARTVEFVKPLTDTLNRLLTVTNRLNVMWYSVASVCR